MIKAETARSIAIAHAEIDVAKKLLEEISEAIGRNTIPDFRDAFGRHQAGMELGVRCGENGRRLFNVPWKLARPVIEAHIAEQRAIISALNDLARSELAETA